MTPPRSADRPEQQPSTDEERPVGARSQDDPDGHGKPQEMDDLPGPNWKYAFKRAAKEFTLDQCTDLAAALTYYAVLAVFPALLAVISLLGLFGQDASTLDAMLGEVRRVSPQAVDTVGPIIKEISGSSASGLALFVGLASALWSASGYVGAFGRAMNRIYEVREGRPFIKLRPLQLALTLAVLLLVALGGVMLVVSGPIATSVGNLLGVGDTALTVWNVAKWPVIAVIVILVIALLYYATPNVQQPKFKWFSPGAAVSFVVWLIASAAFGFYVSNFGSYNKTYGSIAGVIVFLLWLWITNLALLFGAELDSEIERSRQLAAGMPAESQVLLPPRDDKGIKKQDKALDALELEAQDLRRQGRKQRG